MIDHVSVGVSDLSAASEFYDALLGALGMSRKVERETTIGWGKDYPEFWINLRPSLFDGPRDDTAHVCLRARNEVVVRAFHAAALSSGGKDDGEAGMRPQYNDIYYAAFIQDLDGNRIEAVTFIGKDGR